MYLAEIFLNLESFYARPYWLLPPKFQPRHATDRAEGKVKDPLTAA